ncbi:hypothetical protein Tsubulata_036702 [Turnera subulata]|uniref:Carboxypeptidase n=1 Tax=Turnera subulata TaxID=218843 RepID=A0A9Q0FM38_9ROSI|nr:hypothetical protein Tsubulata_036702 [Turnera subulata]
MSPPRSSRLSTLMETEDEFFFGLATAPAHVEDRLNDAWLQFAEAEPCEEASSSSSESEAEQQQTADALLGSAAGDGGSQAAAARVTKGSSSKQKKSLKIALEAMIRGFKKYVEEEEATDEIDCHHNVAAWHNVPHPEERLKFWSDPDTEIKLAKDTGVGVFRLGIDWTRIMPEEPVNGLKDAVNFAALERYKWIISRVRSYGMKVMLTLFHHSLPPWAGEYGGWKLEKTVDYFMDFTSISTSAIVGVAHHVSFMRPYGLFDVAAVTLANSLTVFPYVDSISDKLDFIGINYYGQEVVSGAGLKLVENDEYSESGRGVYPDGLYRVLIQFHERYRHLKLPFIISENGISDETDVIRRPYMLEHLLAGVPVLGYVFWTISDNWEWADGYGPKFGLVAVDRENNLARVPRPSYHLFSKVVTTGKITRMDRARAWNDLQAAAKDGKTRPFYREVNKHGLMYAGGLDEPIQRPFILRDWRFGHYEMEGLQDPLSRLSRCVLRPFSFKRRRKHHDADAELVNPLAHHSHSSQGMSLSTKNMGEPFSTGPGCSSIAYGAASELGPLIVGRNGSGLHFNKYAWNKGDTYSFLVNWLQRFPQYKTRDFYIAGESYAGHYVPQLAELIYDRNKDRTNYPLINLKGFIVGNPETNDYYDYKGLLEYAWSHSVVSDQVYYKARQVCDFRVPDWSDACNDVMNRVFERYSEIDIYNLYAPKCLINTTSSVGSTQINNRGLRRLRLPGGYNPCYSPYAEDYFNRVDVQSSLHAKGRGNPSSKWQACSDLILNNYNHTVFSVLPIYTKLIKGGLKIWMYSGDADGRVPVIGSRYCIEALGLPIKSPWRSWFHHQQVGGRIVEYEGFTFVTVRGAGHLVPLDKPSQALALLHGFLSDQPLPFRG